MEKAEQDSREKGQEMPDSNLPPSPEAHEEQEITQGKLQRADKRPQKRPDTLRTEPTRARKNRSSIERKSAAQKSRVTIKIPAINEETISELATTQQAKDQEESILVELAVKEPEGNAQQEQQQQAKLSVVEEKEIQVEEQKQSPIPQKQTAEITSSVISGKKRRLDTQSVRLLVTGMLLLFLSSSTLLLVHDLTSNYAYAYAISPNNGAILSQQSLESLSADAWLSAPIMRQGQIEIGIQRKGDAQNYQLLRLKSGGTSISKQASLTIDQSHPNLSLTSTGGFISSGPRGLQVRQSDSRLLWQKTAYLPTKGVHRFQVVSDDAAVYSVASATTGTIAAYALGNGKELWMQQIGESLEYTPPFALDNDSLYIASEHAISALNSKTGAIEWQVPVAARTLLIESNRGGDLLLAAGAEGLLALNMDTGQIVWTLAGQSTDRLTATQFYQASLAQDGSRGDIIYASGIRWHLPEIEEQAWLYAVDATTGKQLWSQQLGGGQASGDSSRIFTPLSNQSGVIIQHQESASEQHISAYDRKGNLRWDTLIHGTQQTAPRLLQSEGGTLYLFAIANNGITALSTLPINRYLILLAALLSLCGLMCIWFARLAKSRTQWLEILKHSAQLLWYPQRGAKKAQGSVRLLDSLHAQKVYLENSKMSRGFAAGLLYIRQQKLRWKRSHILISAGLLFLFLIGIIIISLQVLGENRPGIYQVNAVNGNLQWEQSDQGASLAGIDATGSINTQQKNALSWLQANSPDGTHWQTFTSEGRFALATTEGRSDSLLAKLTGNESSNYQFAENDPGYPDALENLFILVSFARQSGQRNWQTILVPPEGQQQAKILGADQSYVYVSSIPDEGANAANARAQLMAVNQRTGNIDWRIFGPAAELGFSSGQAGATINEKLLIGYNHLLWQMQGRIYWLDANSGQIEWQRLLPGEQESGQQLQQMVITTSGAIVVATPKSITSIEQSTGMLLWTQQITSSQEGLQLLAGPGDSILLVRDSQMQAYQATKRQLLWTQTFHGKLQSIISTDDGKQAFLSFQAARQSKTVTLEGIETKRGRITWSATIAEQASQAKLLAVKNGQLLVSICEEKGQQSCVGQRLSMLGTSDGKERWKSGSVAIGSIAINPGGSALAFQID